VTDRQPSQWKECSRSELGEWRPALQTMRAAFDWTCWMLSRFCSLIPTNSVTVIQLGTSDWARYAIHTECNYMARQIWTKDVWKRAGLRTDVLSHQISSHPTPKITPEPHFGEPFNAKPIIQIALRKSHVYGTTKVKLCSYISIGKYLGGVKIIPLGAFGGGVLGHWCKFRTPLLSRKLLELESWN